MPELTTTVSVDVEINFEVYCGTCGDGLCNNTSTRLSRNRQQLQIVVDVCENCISDLRNEKDKDIEVLESELEELKEKIAELNEQLLSGE